MNKKNMIGKRFGRRIVTKFLGRINPKNRYYYWECMCDCGKISIRPGSALRSGNANSCGCAKIEHLKSLAKHNMAKTRIYRSWSAMIQRCTNPNTPGWERYGGRGIRVCKKWKDSFCCFYKEMGDTYRDDLFLERIDNNKGYFKNNCRWATRLEQNNNSSKCVWITIDGIRKNIKQWADYLDFPVGRLYWLVFKKKNVSQKIRDLLLNKNCQEFRTQT